MKGIWAIPIIVGVLILLILIPTQNAYAVSVDSASSGFWDVGSTWVGGTVPALTDDVTIKAGNTVTISSSVTIVGALTIEPNAELIIDGTLGGDFRQDAGLPPSLIINEGKITIIGGSAVASGKVTLNQNFINRGTIIAFGGSGFLSASIDNQTIGNFLNDCSGVIILNGGTGFVSAFFSNNNIFTQRGLIIENPGAGGASGIFINNDFFFDETELCGDKFEKTLVEDLAKSDIECTTGMPIGATTSTMCTFSIEYTGDALLIVDTVPAEWEFVSQTGTCSIESAGKGNPSKSATIIDCGVTDNLSEEFKFQTRQSPGKNNVKFAPTSCDEDLKLNEGAQALDPITLEVIATSNMIGTPTVDDPNDVDCDQVEDDKDNCPAVANRDQADSDGDGVGDACDLFPDDNDNDGVTDDLDQCPDSNPDLPIDDWGCDPTQTDT